ncbi:hypothetical protein [Candidatus Clostridium helianthi]|uniref:Uncharacterized protein n=1 Tax=Candidatus Clostridium helianthi TaxID=3381660 RepID=A0ABW8S6T5_9CLOT
MQINSTAINFMSILIKFICIAVVVAIVIAMVSPMAFDSPGSTESIYTWIFFLSTFSLPAVILISVMMSFFLLFKSKLYNKAIIVSLAPINYFAAIFLLFNT